MINILAWKSKHSVQMRPIAIERIRTEVDQLLNISENAFRSRVKFFRNGENGLRKRNCALVQSLVYGTAVVERVHSIKLHDVQLLAIHHLARGRSVELQTGEGKTLVAAVVATTLAMLGQTVHIATANAYLAARDFEFMRPCHQLLELTSSVLSNSANSNSKHLEYQTQIVYGPGYQFGFDYLHQQYLARNDPQRQFGLVTIQAMDPRTTNHGENAFEKSIRLGFQWADCMIVDEADSVLVDEAMSPLVLAEAATTCDDELTLVAAKDAASKLRQGKEYTLGSNGEIEFLIRIGDYKSMRSSRHSASNRSDQLRRPWKQYVHNALRAKVQIKCGIHYIVKRNEVCIVDQQTGRLHPERHFQNGLHEAIEVHNGLRPTGRSKTLARTARQSFFGRYAKLVGMSGTLLPIAKEIRRLYGMNCIAIPTNKPTRRVQLSTRTFVNQETKLSAIANDCIARQLRGQPVLVGTRSISASLEAASYFRLLGLSPILLNGEQDPDEAETIRLAGTAGTLTIATNMAGRGTDIPITSEVERIGGLHVIASEPNLNIRSDIQLFGRTARRGQPGSAQLFVSLEDEIFERCPPRIKRFIEKKLSKAGESTFDTRRIVQRLQMQREANAYSLRIRMMELDHWYNQVRELLNSDS